MPLQAKANGLQLCQVPPELSSLNALELRLRVPFMKMVALPTGKQRSIHGPAVNVPSKLDTICDVLPRLPSQTEMKLKRKVAYRGHYMYDFVTPHKPLDALRFLKAQNPLYCDIEINDQWFEEAIANDDELGMCLVEQNDDTESDQPETEPQPMECSSDELSLALHKLKSLSLQNGFAIYDVPYDDHITSADSHDTETADNALDDAVIAEGDEHRIQISGAPMASMMCVDNPESFREIICVAPAEGEIYFEAMSNPDKFPYGVGTYSSERPRKLTSQSEVVRC